MFLSRVLFLLPLMCLAQKAGEYCLVVKEPRPILMVKLEGEECSGYKIEKVVRKSKNDSIVVQLRSKFESLKVDSILKCLIQNGFDFDGVRKISSEGYNGTRKILDSDFLKFEPTFEEVVSYVKKYPFGLTILMGKSDSVYFKSFSPEKKDYWKLRGDTVVTQKGVCQTYLD